MQIFNRFASRQTAEKGVARGMIAAGGSSREASGPDDVFKHDATAAMDDANSEPIAAARAPGTFSRKASLLERVGIRRPYQQFD